MKKVILGFLFTISLSILLLILFMPFGGGIQTIYAIPTKGIFGMLSNPELSDVNETFLKVMDPLLSTIFLLSIIGGVIMPFRLKSAVNTRLKWSFILITIVVIVMGWNALYYEGNLYSGGSRDGFAVRTYIWHKNEYDKLKEWRSEKCDTCYAPGERIKWIFIREYKEKRN